MESLNSLSIRSCLMLLFPCWNPDPDIWPWLYWSSYEWLLFILILTYDLGSIDQAMNDSSFHMIWVVGLEMQIMTCMCRFPVHFHGQFRTPLHDRRKDEYHLLPLPLWIWW
jgi:hypothetical protein